MKWERYGRVNKNGQKTFINYYKKVKHKVKRIIVFIVITNIIFTISCSQNRGKLEYGENGKLKSGTGYAKCEPPVKRYASNIEGALKGVINDVEGKPYIEISSTLGRKITQLKSDYSQKGLDFDLIMFRICEMSINRGFSSEQTSDLIGKALKAWETISTQNNQISNEILSTNLSQVQNIQNSQGSIQVGGNLTIQTVNSINEDIPKKFPQDLDFYGINEIDFEKPKTISFESDQAKIEFVLSKIYMKENKFYITFLVNLLDKINNSNWLAQKSEAEIIENNLAKAKTDRFDLYFYVLKTELKKAKIYIGVKMVNRGIKIKNITVKGNAIKFD